MQCVKSCLFDSRMGCAVLPRYKSWRSLNRAERKRAKQVGWSGSSWETARKAGKAEAEADAIRNQITPFRQSTVNPNVGSLMGREVVLTTNTQAERVAHDFQLFGSDQRLKSPYSDSVTLLPPYNVSITSSTFWHGLNVCSGDLCLLLASYLPCVRVQM